ncbi:MAG TPA: MauE/DoxX family redox-associated membrane protein, partial [Desulfotignum sp.]|nr:MauE/DoxX family redox-associated membrane protein [Desulfotignum sp.]
MPRKHLTADGKLTFGYHFTRLVMAGVFIYASLDKIIHPDLFAEAVYNYQVLPGFLVNLTALILPWLELTLGTCLLINRWMAGASALAAVLMALFVGMILFNLARGLDISCGCFSAAPDDGPITALTLVRDMLFLIFSLTLAGLVFVKNTRRV